MLVSCNSSWTRCCPCSDVARLVQQPGDVEQFVPTVAAAQAAADVMCAARGDAEDRIGTVVADAGYLPRANLTAAGPDRLTALGKRRDQERQARDRPTSGPRPSRPTPAKPWPPAAHRARHERLPPARRHRRAGQRPSQGPHRAASLLPTRAGGGRQRTPARWHGRQAAQAPPGAAGERGRADSHRASPTPQQAQTTPRTTPPPGARCPAAMTRTPRPISQQAR